MRKKGGMAHMKKKIQKMTLALLILIAIGYAIYEYYLTSSNENIAMLKNEISVRRSMLEQLYDIRKNKSQIEKQIQNIEMEHANLEEKVPSKDYGLELISDFKIFIMSRNIYFDDRKYMSTEERGNYYTSIVPVDVKGSLGEIRQVINFLNNYKRKLYIKGIRLQAKPDNSYFASINLELYYMKK